MDDRDFEKLKADIETAMRKLERLQQLYIKETGRRYVPPIRLTIVKDKDLGLAS